MLSPTQPWRKTRGGGLTSSRASGERPVELNVALFIACVLFALAFITIPWPDIFAAAEGRPMIDRTVYRIQMLTRNLSIDYMTFDKKISYITGEYLWNISVKFLNRQVGLSPDFIFSCISFITIFSFSITIARSTRFFWSFFLLNPLVVDLAFSQLRIALAVGIALIALDYYKNRPVRATFVALVLSMIHTASVLFFVMGGVAKWISSRAAWAKGYLATLPLFLSGAVVSLLIGPARATVLGVIGDRRANYQDMSSTSLYLAFWVALLAVLVFRWKANSRRFETAIAIVILSVVAVNLVTGGYSTRFLAVAFPFIIIAIAGLDGIYRLAVVYALLFYTMFQWLYWLRLLG